MRRFSLLWMVLLALLLISCEGAKGSPAPLAPPVSPTTVAQLPARTNPDPLSTFRFTSLSVEDGLSENSVKTILQDQQGFLWIGTQDGLDRYDGYQFKVYRPNPNKTGSLSDRWINDLYEDRDGYLWVATRQGGLNQYNPRSDTFINYRHQIDQPASLSSDEVHRIVQDSAGQIWVGTANGLDRLDSRTGAIQRYPHAADQSNSPGSDAINALLLDKQGNLWIGTDDAGLDRFEPSTGVFRHYRSDPKSETSINSDSIISIQEASNGGLWVATSGGLSRLDGQSGQIRRVAIPPSPSGNPALLETIYVDRTGILWVGTQQGLDRFDERTGKWINYHHIPTLSSTLDNDDILSIFEDREGILWVGTYGGGIDKHNPAEDRFAYFRNNPEDANSLANNVVFSFYVEPSGVTWIGTMGGLDRFDPASDEFRHFKHDPALPGSLSDNLVWSIFRDSQGKLWVGTQAGLDQLDESTGEWIHFRHDPQDPDSIAHNIVYRIYEDQAGVLWFGTRQGLDRFDRQKGNFIHYHDPDSPSRATKDRVIAIQEDRNGNLWVGTFNNGVFLLDRDRKQFTYFKKDPQKADTLSNNSIMAINLDHAGNIWIATVGGMNEYLPTSNSFIAYTEQDGLPNDVVYAVIEDRQGFLWLSTNLGISRFDPKNKTFRSYTVSDGLQGNEFNEGAYAVGPDGAIYFGGTNGFNVFRPEQVQENPYLPPVALADLLVDGKPIPSAVNVAAMDEMTLQWPQESFAFDFTSLSFAEPQNNQFAYKLEPFDRDWIQIGNKRSGRYTNLPGGTYTLRLKASNGDGVWNETGKAIRVNVIAPFWKTGWFYGLIGLTMFGLAAVVYRLRVRNIEQQKHELERQVSERTRKIEQLFEQNKELAVIEERNRLARELHDSAKQKAFAGLAQLGAVSGLINHDPTAARKHLAEAENLVSEVIQELTFFIQEMYPIALKEKGLANALLEYLFDWETRTDIRVNLRIDGEGHLPLDVEQAIYRIVQESLANIARHSRASKVDFSVIYQGDNVEVCISDNGRGFDLQQKPNGIGLRSMHERAGSIGGTLDVDSEPGQGTRVILHVPASKYEYSTGGLNG